MTHAMPQATAAVPSERSLLIVEDDKSFLQRLARAMEMRGFAVTTAESVADGLLQDLHVRASKGADVTDAARAAIEALERRR